MTAALTRLLLELLTVTPERAHELAEQHQVAAELAGVSVADLVGLDLDESNMDHHARGQAGERGAMQLLPASPWGRAWLREASGYWALTGDVLVGERLNVLWGAYTLADGLKVCRGSLVHAYGFYRTGKCVAGPRSKRTAKRAEWVRERLGT